MVSPIQVRTQIIAVSIAMAFILYLDRVCLSEIVKSDAFKADFNASDQQIGKVLGAFFFTYALLQIPAGWLSDRYGARVMLTMYIVVWSLMTGLSGFATSIGTLLIARLAIGAAQAGAYPTSGGVIRNWFPLHQRTKASSWVAFGGRVGGAAAPLITAVLIVGLNGWREVLYLYCGIGLVIAWFYWRVVRDAPTEHNISNQGENPDRTESLVDTTSGKPFVRLIAACFRSRSLWLVSIAQFCINVGWAFLVTWLPTFVKNSGQVTEVTGATLVTLVLSMAMLGQLIGGVCGDFAVQRVGLRWGRILPTAGPALMSAIAYACCPAFSSIWLVLFCCGIVSLMNDIANPSIWGIMQDIGGENTSAIYGWMNMFGNLGASLSSIMVPYLLLQGQTIGVGDLLVFVACSGAYFFAAACLLGIDATKVVR